jgi:hypothetical protein
MAEKETQKMVETKDGANQDFIEKRQQTNQVPTPPRQSAADMQALLGVVGPGEVPQPPQSSNSAGAED